MVQESLDALTTCVTQDIGFSEGKPVAALTIYRFLLHWKSFEAERTSVFDRLVNMIGDAIKVTLYTLSNYEVILLSVCLYPCVCVPASVRVSVCACVCLWGDGGKWGFVVFVDVNKHVILKQKCVQRMRNPKKYKT